MKNTNDVILNMSNINLMLLVCSLSVLIGTYYGVVAMVWAFLPDFSTALITFILVKIFFCMSLILRKKQLLQEVETRKNKTFTRKKQDSGEGVDPDFSDDGQVVDAEILTEITAEQSSTDLDPVQAESEYSGLIDEGIAALKVKDVLAAFPALDYKTVKEILEAKFLEKKLNRAIRYRADGTVHQCRYSYPESDELGGIETSTGAKAA